MTKTRFKMLTPEEEALLGKASRYFFINEWIRNCKPDNAAVVSDWTRNQIPYIYFNGFNGELAFPSLTFTAIDLGDKTAIKVRKKTKPISNDVSQIKKDKKPASDIEPHTKNLNLTSENIDETKKDLNLTIENSDQVKMDLPTSEDIDIALNQHFPNYPLIRDYIKNNAYQSGFLFASLTATTQKLQYQQKVLLPTERELHFIDNLDGSVTYIEKYPIYGYFNIDNPTDKINREDGLPIAIITTVSVIKPFNGEIKHEIINDNIFMLDPLAEELFNQENDGYKSKHYDTHPEQIDAEFLAAVQRKVTTLKAKNQPLADDKSATTSESKSLEEDSSSLTSSRPSMDITSHVVVAPQANPLALQMDSLFSPRPIHAPAPETEIKPAKAQRRSDWEVIRNMTISFALTGFLIGGGIGIAGGVFGAVPTFGLSLLAIPILAAGGLLLGAVIGFTGSAIGCALARIPSKKKADPKPLVESAEVTSSLRPSVSPDSLRRRAQTIAEPSIENKPPTNSSTVELSKEKSYKQTGASEGGMFAPQNGVSLPETSSRKTENKPTI